MTRALHVATVGLLLAAGASAATLDETREAHARAATRLAFHLARAETLHQALAPAVYGPCPRFPNRPAWDAWLNERVEEGVTFAAHLDEAWRQAKRSEDASLRAGVKAAKRRMLTGDPVGLVKKLSRCAWANGSVLDAWTLWRRAAAEVPRRRVEVAREADAAVTPG